MLNDGKNRNWWRRRISLEKCLLLVSVFIAATETVVNADNKRMRKSVDSNVNNICLSQECNNTATEVLRKMNTEMEPCKDFYQFACGNFYSGTQITDNKIYVNTFSIISDSLSEQLKDIIIEERSNLEPKHIRLPNAFYKACMNESLIDSLGIKPMQQYANILGGWPVVVGHSWNSNNTWTWQETVKNFRHLGFKTDYIFSFGVTEDAKNKTGKIINLDEPFSLFNWKYLIGAINDTVIQDYYNIMIDVAALFGAKKANAFKELKESLDFEMELANITLLSEIRYDPNDFYNLYSIKEMQNSYPYVEWLDYINALLPENITVDENEIINVRVPTFFDELGKLLNRTDERIIANYMMWQIHVFSLLSLPHDFLKRQVPSLAASIGSQTQMTRSEGCINEALGFEYAIGSLYIRKHLKRYPKGAASEMVNNIREAFSQIIDETAWMDDDTKYEAKKKLRSMATLIGYHDDFLDNDKLEKYYNKLEIDPDKYLESLLNRNVFETDNSLSRLRLPVNKTDWGSQTLPHKVTAFYSMEDNVIGFPAGIWQGNLFNSQRPKYMNYGAIGNIIGHEISHGLIDEDSQWNGSGIFVNWWQPDTRSKFMQKVKCVIEQYGNYTDKQTGLNLNGIKTQRENIADNSGIKISYRAYNQWVDKNGPEPRLPDLDYSPQQMFWISFAQTLCAKYTTEYLEEYILTNVHPPKEFRVLGSLRNIKDFSRDFQCPEGSPMNLVHKCEIW